MKILRQRFIILVGLLIVGCIAIVDYLFPARTRLLPGYETLQQTDQGMPLIFEMVRHNKLTCVSSSVSI